MVEVYSDPSAGDEAIADLDEIRSIFQLDSVQNILARLQASNTEFAIKTRKVLEFMSPLSVAVVFEQIRRGKTMTIEDVFRMEYGMVRHWVNNPDFANGVNA